MVDIKLEEKFENPVTLKDIKANSKLKDMKLVQLGNRLSVMPVTKSEFNEIIKMSK
ncbi:EVE domain-containing protein [Bacteroidota bacterium]